MKKELDGVIWDLNELSFETPFPSDRGKSCSFFLQSLATFTWNTLRSFEDNPATLTQTTSILAGLIQEDKFELSTSTACHLHNYVGKEDALEWGIIRSRVVSLHNISFVPPTKDLENIIQNGFHFLQHEVANPVERAIGVFLFMTRHQPLYDAKKRNTSLLMKSGVLANGYSPITVLNQNSEEFHRELGSFYESGNANNMFRFFQKTIQELYSEEQYKSFSANSK